MDMKTIRRWADASTLRCSNTPSPNGTMITLPNGAAIEISTDFFPVNWHLEFEKDTGTSRLWYRSLAYIPSLLGSENGWPIVNQFLKSFLGFMQKGAADFSVIKMSSLDHALAIQIRVCCEIFSRADGEDCIDKVESRASIVEVMPLLAQFARLPGMRPNNNHGIMLSLALLQAAVTFPKIVSLEEARDDAAIGVEQLGSIFDEDGLSHENTPTYQGLYVRLLRDFTELSSMSPRMSQESARFSKVHTRASTAYRRMLLPDGRVPPIGDGGLGLERELTPLPGKFVSTDNGLYIHSNSDSYLAVICGARSPIHKQMDDTSVLMVHNGKFAILDAGIHNYDPNNPVGASIRTQQGHSGVFFTKFDHEPLKFFNSGGSPRRVSATMEFSERDAQDHLVCEYTLENHRVRREVTTNSPTSMAIVDSCWSPDGSSAVARFLLSENMDLVSSNGLVEGKDGEINVKIQTQPGTRYRIRRGVISWTLKQRDQCWMVEVEIPSGGAGTAINIKVESEDGTC